MKVSVVICTYNGEKYLRQQLDSILMQTKMPDEIILVDDCSTDNTNNIIREYQSKFNIIKYFKNDKNLGYKDNFPNALSKSGGDIVFLSDQDDLWDENKVAYICDAFVKTNANIVGSNIELIDENNRCIKPFYKRSFALKFSNSKKQVLQIIKDSKFPGMSIAVRKTFLDKCYPFPKCYPHDEWITTLAALDNSIVVLNKTLSFYRQHSSQTIGLTKSLQKSIANTSSVYVELEKANSLVDCKTMHKNSRAISLAKQKQLFYAFRIKQRKRNFFIAVSCIIFNYPMHMNYIRFCVSPFKSELKDIFLKERT